MVEVLITLIVCGTIIWVTHKPIRFEIHKKFEEIPIKPSDLKTQFTEEELKKIEENQKTTDSLNEAAKFIQDFLGGGIEEDAEPKQ